MLPYRVVLKRQKKWERPGDPGSWRRECGLAASGFGGTFTGRLRWPASYLARSRDDETELWMEYISGVSGDALTAEMLEEAALEWGRWQGRLYREPGLLRDAGCLGDAGFPEREFGQWHRQTYPYDFLVSEPCRIPGRLKRMLRDGEITLTDGKSFEYGCLRSVGCGIPGHLKRMLMDADSRSADTFRALAGLPTVLCHRDLWLENVFYADGEIILIDWDTAGWGFPVEDIASLIADDTDPARIPEYFRRLVPAYLEGVSGFMDLPPSFGPLVWEMMVIRFGYRFVQRYMFADSPDDRDMQVEALQKIYEIRGTL